MQKSVLHIQPTSTQTKKICKSHIVQNLLLIKLISTNYKKCVDHILPHFYQTKKNCITHIVQKGLCKILYIHNLVQKGVTKMKHRPDLTNEVRSFRSVGHFLREPFWSKLCIQNIFHKVLSASNIFAKFCSIFADISIDEENSAC